MSMSLLTEPSTLIAVRKSSKKSVEIPGRKKEWCTSMHSEEVSNSGSVHIF